MSWHEHISEVNLSLDSHKVFLLQEKQNPYFIRTTVQFLKKWYQPFNTQCPQKGQTY